MIALEIDWKQIGTDLGYVALIIAWGVTCYGVGVTISPFSRQFFHSNLKYVFMSSTIGFAALLSLLLFLMLAYLIWTGIKDRYTVQENRNISQGDTQSN